MFSFDLSEIHFKVNALVTFWVNLEHQGALLLMHATLQKCKGSTSLKCAATFTLLSEVGLAMNLSDCKAGGGYYPNLMGEQYGHCVDFWEVNFP